MTLIRPVTTPRTMTRSLLTRRAALKGLSCALIPALVLPGMSIQAAAQASQSDLLAPGELPDFVLGPANAPVTIIEYASMTCGHCATFATETFPKLKSKYIDSGKVRFMLREFPLDTLAAAVFMLARSQAGDNAEKYVQLVDGFFATQSDWAVKNPVEPLKKVARQMGINEEAFVKAIENKDMLAKMSASRDRAADKFGVKATPTFFINGKAESGALSIEQLSALIDPLLKG